MQYLITPSQSTDWQINPLEFVKNLSKQWSDIKIEKVSNPEDIYSLEWSIKPPQMGAGLDGGLHQDEQGISLDGYLEDCAKFAIWFRSQVPTIQELVFYDQSYNHSIELKTDTKDVEIIDVFTDKIIVIV